MHGERKTTSCCNTYPSFAKVGTEFGDKLSMALMTCMGDDAEEATRSLNRRRGKGEKGKGKSG